MSDPDRPVGLTRDAGWQVGVRRSVAADPEEVWEYLFGPEGLALWLGAGTHLRLERGAAYTASDGATGEVRSIRPGEMIRLTWWPPGWEASSTLQVRLAANATGTSIAFHQERLSDGAVRQAMKDRWEAVLDRLIAHWAG